MQTPTLCPITGKEKSCLQYIASKLFLAALNVYLAASLIVPDRDCHVLIQSDQN